jgi:hypothetical protein
MRLFTFSMKQFFDLSRITAGQEEPLALFAVTTLGIIDSFASGAITPSEAITSFFHAKNIRFVKSKLGDDRAMEILGRGTQLGDLFDALPIEEAHREFQHELQAMKSLCYALLDAERAAA